MMPSDDPEPLTKLNLNMPPEAPQTVVPAAESLQFQTAEMPSSNRHFCSACHAGFEGEYYQMAGLTTCPKCAQDRLAERERKGSWAEVGRAALFGLGAAAAGSALYAIIGAVTGFQFSLVAIVVGVFVGKAVLRGSRGTRGRRFQVLAVLLTYGSITSSALPDIVKEISKSVDEQAAKEKAAGGSVEAAKSEGEKPPSAGGLALGFAFLLAIAAIAPFFGVTSISGILNLIIIWIGLKQAWQRTASDTTEITGPHQVAAEAAAAGA